MECTDGEHFKLDVQPLMLGTGTKFYPVRILTHLCRVDSSTLTLWTGPFLYKGCLVSFYYCHVL